MKQRKKIYTNYWIILSTLFLLAGESSLAGQEPESQESIQEVAQRLSGKTIPFSEELTQKIKKLFPEATPDKLASIITSPEARKNIKSLLTHIEQLDISKPVEKTIRQGFHIAYRPLFDAGRASQEGRHFRSLISAFEDALAFHAAAINAELLSQLNNWNTLWIKRGYPHSIPWKKWSKKKKIIVGAVTSAALFGLLAYAGYRRYKRRKREAELHTAQGLKEIIAQDRTGDFIYPNKKQAPDSPLPRRTIGEHSAIDQFSLLGKKLLMQRHITHNGQHYLYFKNREEAKDMLPAEPSPDDNEYHVTLGPNETDHIIIYDEDGFLRNLNISPLSPAEKAQLQEAREESEARIAVWNNYLSRVDAINNTWGGGDIWGGATTGIDQVIRNESGMVNPAETIPYATVIERFPRGENSWGEVASYSIYNIRRFLEDNKREEENRRNQIAEKLTQAERFDRFQVIDEIKAEIEEKRAELWPGDEKARKTIAQSLDAERKRHSQ